MNQFERAQHSFEISRENDCTGENEIVQCEQCDDNFARPIESDYRVCSKKCYDEACAEFRGDI